MTERLSIIYIQNLSWQYSAESLYIGFQRRGWHPFIGWAPDRARGGSARNAGGAEPRGVQLMAESTDE